MAAIEKSIGMHISASESLRIAILVSKYMFLGSRNSIMTFVILLEKYFTAILDFKDGRHKQYRDSEGKGDTFKYLKLNCK